MSQVNVQQQPRFVIRQKITPMANRYTVSVPLPDGKPGPTVAYVEQARFKFKEEVTFYTDESKQWEVFRFKARSVIDFGATYDVFTPQGEALGLFRKDAKASFLRSTWHLEPAGQPPAKGQERSAVLGIMRRISDLAAMFPFHFDFERQGQPLMRIDRKVALRDTYLLEIADPHLDRRLAIAMAVALDALQAR